MSDEGDAGKRQKFNTQKLFELIQAKKEARAKRLANGESEPVRVPSAGFARIRAQREARQAQREARQERLKNGLTIEALRATEDEELGQLVFEYLCNKISDAGMKGRAAAEWVMKLPTELRAIYVSTVLYGEVGNGGFAAVYYNSTPEFEPFFLEGFELMGAMGHAEIVRRAIELHRRGETEAMGKLDKEFYALGRTKQFNELQGRFIRGRMETFAVD